MLLRAELGAVNEMGVVIFYHYLFYFFVRKRERERERERDEGKLTSS